MATAVNQRMRCMAVCVCVCYISMLVDAVRITGGGGLVSSHGARWQYKEINKHSRCTKSPG